MCCNDLSLSPPIQVNRVLEVLEFSTIYTCDHNPFICIISVLVIVAKAMLYYFIVLLDVVKADPVKFDMQAQ